MSIRLALAGNPNCGKTTMFNDLTGSTQYVGNWPGVTVEKKEGRYKADKQVSITDLPGIYSLSPYTLEEVITRDYLVHEKPDAILNLVDAANIERNLYLTTQLLEMGIPVVVALNMMDIVEKRGDVIDTAKLSAKLGVPVVQTTALKGKGTKELVEAAKHAAKSGAKPAAPAFSDAIEQAIGQIASLIADVTEEDQRRWFAVKLFERDEKVLARFRFGKDTLEKLEAIITAVEDELNDDAESIITDARYQYIAEVVKPCVKKQKSGMTVSDKIDRIVTNRILALPIFALVMFVVYYVSVTTVGKALTDWANDGVFGEGWELFGAWIPGIPTILGGALSGLGIADWLYSLIMDGIVAGVGAVLGFVPQILVLFLFLAILEDCGYMARVAFIMDRIFRKFGLSGKSFIPMLIGTGCGVPGIMASRTIESESARRLTVMTTTFMPCSAKLPIIALIATAIFGGVWWVAPLAYFMGIAAIIVSGIILRKTRPFMGKVTPYVMELPEYRLPRFVDLLRSMWDRAWAFIKKAGTIILLATIVVWFLSGYGIYEGQFMWVGEDLMDYSFLAYFGNAFAWIFAPLGFNNWECASTVITGLIAKENVISTMAVVYGGDPNVAWTSAYMASLAATTGSVLLVPVAAFAFMTFQLLCAPCFAAMGAIKREMGGFNKWFWAAIGWECGFAYVISLIIFQIGAWVVTGIFSLGTIVAIVLIAALLWALFRPASKPAAPAQADTTAKAAA